MGQCTGGVKVITRTNKKVDPVLDGNFAEEVAPNTSSKIKKSFTIKGTISGGGTQYLEPTKSRE